MHHLRLGVQQSRIGVGCARILETLGANLCPRNCILRWLWVSLDLLWQKAGGFLGKKNWVWLKNPDN